MIREVGDSNLRSPKDLILQLKIADFKPNFNLSNPTLSNSMLIDSSGTSVLGENSPLFAQVGNASILRGADYTGETLLKSGMAPWMDVSAGNWKL